MSCKTRLKALHPHGIAWIHGWESFILFERMPQPRTTAQPEASNIHTLQLYTVHLFSSTWRLLSASHSRANGNLSHAPKPWNVRPCSSMRLVFSALGSGCPIQLWWVHFSSLCPSGWKLRFSPSYRRGIHHHPCFSSAKYQTDLRLLAERNPGRSDSHLPPSSAPPATLQELQHVGRIFQLLQVLLLHLRILRSLIFWLFLLWLPWDASACPMATLFPGPSLGTPSTHQRFLIDGLHHTQMTLGFWIQTPGRSRFQFSLRDGE